MGVGTELEDVPNVSYLVINVLIMLYLYGYDGFIQSNLFINMHEVLYVFCGRSVGKKGNFVGRLISYVFKSFVCK